MFKKSVYYGKDVYGFQKFLHLHKIIFLILLFSDTKFKKKRQIGPLDIDMMNTYLVLPILS